MAQAEQTGSISARHTSLSGQAFGVEVKDESAMPEVRPGEFVVVDPAAHVPTGKLVLAVLEREKIAVIGRYRKADTEGDDDCFTIEPVNPAYPQVVVNDDNPGFVLGRVVQHVRTLE